jgi:adenosine deaminase
VPVSPHLQRQLLDDGLRVSLATDDPLMFGCFTVADAFAAIATPLGLGDETARALARNGVEAAFVTEERRTLLRRQLEAPVPAP